RVPLLWPRTGIPRDWRVGRRGARRSFGSAGKRRQGRKEHRGKNDDRFHAGLLDTFNGTRKHRGANHGKPASLNPDLLTDRKRARIAGRESTVDILSAEPPIR